MTKILYCALLLLLAGPAGAESYGVFHCVYQNDDCVETPRQTSIADALDLMRAAARAKDNFVGFVDRNGTTLQFYVERPGHFWVEIPAPELKGSYGRDLTSEEAFGVVRKLTGDLEDQKKALGLKLRKW